MNFSPILIAVFIPWLRLKCTMKVTVVGAGPSGSVAAVSALRAGHEVRVFEEHGRSGYPQHCSGLISKEGLESLTDVADYSPHVINRITNAAFDFAGEKFEIRRKSEAALVIDRAEFDCALAQRAKEEGAKVEYGKRFSHSAGTLNTKPETIIGADGALSATASHFKFPKIGEYAFTLKAMAKVKCDPSTVTLFYDNGLFPGFFGWVIPHDEYEAEVGMGTTSRNHMASGFRAIMQKAGATPLEKPRGKIIPISQRGKFAQRLGGLNVMLVGDAAGQVKSSSGGGVVFGTSGARLAGEWAHAPETYERLWKKECSNDMLAHSLMRRFFAAQPGFGLRLTASLSRAAGLDYLFALHGNMDRPTRFFGFIAKAFNIREPVMDDDCNVGTGEDA